MNEQILKYLGEIENLSMDINVSEINKHLAFSTMNQWLCAWQNAMKQCIDNIKEEIK